MADKSNEKPEWQLAEEAAQDPAWPPMAPAVAIRWVPGRPETFPGVGTAGSGPDGAYLPAETKAYLTKAQYDAGLQAGFIERVSKADQAAPAEAPAPAEATPAPTDQKAS